jgi:hypothetical protein
MHLLVAPSAFPWGGEIALVWLGKQAWRDSMAAS